MTATTRRPSGRTTPLLLLLAGLLLIAAGCRGSASETSEGPGASESQAEADPNEPGNGPGDDEDGQSIQPGESGEDPSAEPRLVPELVLPGVAPGTDQAAADLLEDLSRFLTDEQVAEGVPWPELRNPDPVEAYMAAANFQQWMMENNPTPTLVDAYTAPASPERGWDLDMFDRLNQLDLRAAPGTPPYSMRVEELVHPAATGITDTLLAQVPEGSAAVVYWDSVGPSDNFTSDGQYWSTDPGWTDVGPWVAIMAPTDVGWQVWWDELTEPPPPGSREKSGPPEEDIPRRDL